MLISIHLPKTAGSSFRSALEGFYGDSIESDYGDYPINKKAAVRNYSAIKNASKNLIQRPGLGVKCIHGHFMPLKYRWLKTDNKNFVVWLRDPIERLASHYFYWKRDYQPETAGDLRKRVVEEEWNLEKFCFSSEMQNIYSSFFWGFPHSRFDFVGITENYESDLSYFSENFLGTALDRFSTNVNKHKGTKHYIDDADLRARLELFHQKDMQLYKQALKVSEARKLPVFKKH